MAAGKSNRLNSNTPKPYIHYKGDILINHSINKAILSKKFSKIVIAFNKNHKKYIKKINNQKISFVIGGKTRAESSKNCLKFLKKFKPKNILIHDAARPDFSIKLINKLLFALKDYDGAIPVLKSKDSVKLKEKQKIFNLNRDKILLSQTPQAFRFKELFNLQKKISKNTTDDISLLIDENKKIKIVKGEEKNLKITSLQDLKKKDICFGIGFDIHRLVPNRKLYLGGLEIKSKLGTLGHSDGDPVLHSITDAVLGATSMGDIGEKFSDRDKKFRNIRSTILLEQVVKEIKLKGYFINNLDINIITQTPKIKNYKNKIIKIISKICQISKNQINIKGKTTEKLGIIGKEKAIACEVLASVSRHE